MDSKDNDAEKRILELMQGFVDRKAPLYYAPVSMQQEVTAMDRPAKGHAWASRDVFPAPSDDAVVRVVLDAIIDLGSGAEDFAAPSSAAVKVQWSGYRKRAQEKKEESEISEKENGSPAAVRNVTVELARLSGGRCLVVDYRLSPQNPFPFALIDLFIAYLSLLYPRWGFFHKAVPPEHIVLAGDSSGGNLVLALLLLLQFLRDKRGGRVKFHGQEVLVPLPAGIAALGLHGDVTNSFPSYERNARYDWLADVPPVLSDRFPSCPIWPSVPSRGDIYCEISALTHPLVSPAASTYWKSMPLMFLAYGEERLIDAGKFIAQRASNGGAVVRFHQYDRLSHLFALLFPNLPQSRHLFREWARFCHTCVNNLDSLESKNVRYGLTDEEFKGVDNGPFSTMEYESVMKRMRERQAKRKVWTGPTDISKL
ncbi:MAG: hypothetical protein M1816_006577 [Peltula sp. TS41687]|nr:MAG: hypothetical protein M1816_006577 [Peltula sp. TS41687]